MGGRNHLDRPLTEAGPPADRQIRSRGRKQLRCQTCGDYFDDEGDADEHAETTGHEQFSRVLVTTRFGSVGDG